MVSLDEVGVRAWGVKGTGVMGPGPQSATSRFGWVTVGFGDVRSCSAGVTGLVGLRASPSNKCCHTSKLFSQYGQDFSYYLFKLIVSCSLYILKQVYFGIVLVRKKWRGYRKE